MTRRLLLGYLGMTLFVLVALEVPLGVQNARTERRDLVAKVAHDATALASVAEDAVQSRSPAQLAGVAKVSYDYSRRTGARVVIVDKQGYALIDTSRRVAGTESFASRPEIKAALQGNYPSGVRRSATLNTQLLYVAVPIASSGVVHGAVRITYPLSTVDARILRYWLLLAAIGATVLVAAALIGLSLARFVTRPLRGLEDAAAAVGEGDLDARAPESSGPPEVRSLAVVFNETVAKLAQLLRSQEAFVADASHELRTPLTALRLRLENLERGLGGDERRDADAALHEVERLSQMVEGLLALARADAGATPAARVDAGAVIRERVATWRVLADERGLTLAADADGAVPVRASPERLAQVLDNLVANALDHAPEGTTVTVSARLAAPWAELHVQ
ncbi:MAG TPA: histidine kinase dimerization/phospho-acceptor domain-containing protein, partial [Gaiellaceae bacterium]|nr:histidine kinase dimerization/phospho-acceptor domain-containing protein [Gaiellaceae bacterium]